MTKKKVEEYHSGFEAMLFMMTALRMKMLKCTESGPKRFVDISNECEANHSSLSEFISMALQYGLIRERIIYPEGTNRSKKLYEITSMGRRFVRDCFKYQKLFSKIGRAHV